MEYTDKVVYLEDEEIALIRRGEKLKVVNLKNVECPHEVKTVALNLGQLEKGGYPHFMPEGNLRTARLHSRLHARAYQCGGYERGSFCSD